MKTTPICDCLRYKFADNLVPAITCLVNESLGSGRMPTIFKKSLVTPLLKKPGAPGGALDFQVDGGVPRESQKRGSKERRKK